MISSWWVEKGTLYNKITLWFCHWSHEWSQLLWFNLGIYTSLNIINVLCMSVSCTLKKCTWHVYINPDCVQFPSRQRISTNYDVQLVIKLSLSYYIYSSMKLYVIITEHFPGCLLSLMVLNINIKSSAMSQPELTNTVLRQSNVLGTTKVTVNGKAMPQNDDSLVTTSIVSWFQHMVKDWFFSIISSGTNKHRTLGSIIMGRTIMPSLHTACPC